MQIFGWSSHVALKTSAQMQTHLNILLQNLFTQRIINIFSMFDIDVAVTMLQHFVTNLIAGKVLRLGGIFPIQCFKVEKNRPSSFGLSLLVVSRTFKVFRVLFCQNGCKTFAQLFGLSYSDSRAQPSLGPLNINVHITHISLTFLTRKCRK